MNPAPSPRFVIFQVSQKKRGGNRTVDAKVDLRVTITGYAEHSGVLRLSPALILPVYKAGNEVGMSSVRRNLTSKPALEL